MPGNCINGLLPSCGLYGRLVSRDINSEFSKFSVGNSLCSVLSEGSNFCQFISAPLAAGATSSGLRHILIYLLIGWNGVRALNNERIKDINKFRVIPGGNLAVLHPHGCNGKFWFPCKKLIARRLFKGRGLFLGNGGRILGDKARTEL